MRLLNASPHEMVKWNIAVVVETGDSGVVIRYQVDEFTHPWLEEQFISQLHIYPGFIGKVSTLTHFNQAVTMRIIPF